MPSQNGNGGRGGRWGSGAKPDSDIENLVRQGQERLNGSCRVVTCAR